MRWENLGRSEGDGGKVWYDAALYGARQISRERRGAGTRGLESEVSCWCGWWLDSEKLVVRE